MSSGGSLDTRHWILCVCVCVCCNLADETSVYLLLTSYGDMSVTAIACPVLCCCFMFLLKSKREGEEGDRKRVPLSH